MKISLSAALLLCAASATQVFAGEIIPPTDVQVLSFSDLRAACETPALFHNQTAPANIQVSCASKKTVWVLDPLAVNVASAPITEQVTTSVQSDKYSVDAVIMDMPLGAEALACSSYKQVNQSIETLRAISCAEIVAYADTLNQFCVETLRDLVAANPEALISEDTGRVFSQCADAAKSN